MPTAEAHRREGRADAVVKLVMTRRFSTMQARDWCRLLDVGEVDVQDALDRLRRAADPTYRGRRGKVKRPKVPPGVNGGARFSNRGWHKCELCGATIQVGKRRQVHFAEVHPGEGPGI
jgi:hypothetical protein